MSDERPNPVMTADDVAAAIFVTLTALAAAGAGKKVLTPNEMLDVVAVELRDMVDGMKKRGDQGTPGSICMTMLADLLDASAPSKRERA